MTNEEMVEWAQLEQASEWVWHARKENLDALIWIAQMQGRVDAFAQMSASAKQMADAQKLASYPGGLLKRKKNNG